MRPFLTTMLVLSSLALFAAADTIIPGGNISGNWNATGSPYLVQGDITVPSGQTLNIGPGVEVVFQGHYTFEVDGTLRAAGTANDSILITAADDSIGWNGLKFLSTSDNSSLSYCIVEQGRDTTWMWPVIGGGGIFIYQANININHCTIRNCTSGSGGGIMVSECSPIISNCVIRNNHINYSGNGGGINGYSTNMQIYNCIIDSNTTGFSGGGLYVRSGNAIIDSTTVNGNTAGQSGGGIYLEGGTHTVSFCIVINNNAVDGGGLYCKSGIHPISHTIICDNMASWRGGGIYFDDNTSALYEDVSIYDNTTFEGGGIFFANNYAPAFSLYERCNIYSNQASWGRDLFKAYTSTIMNVIVDTFTVMNPTQFYAFPIQQFAFNIRNTVVQLVDADLYVSPQGDDGNTGLSWADPIRTVGHALSIIQATPQSPHTVYLSAGIFSPDSTGESFPIYGLSYASIQGAGEDLTILDADSTGNVFYLNQIHCAVIENLTIKHGSAQDGGGIYSENSSATIRHCAITQNISNDAGGGIYTVSSNLQVEYCGISQNQSISAYYAGGGIHCNQDGSIFSNCVIIDNATNGSGGGMYLGGGNPHFQNCTVVGNYALHGGGSNLASTSSVLQNCTFFGNSSPDGAGLKIYNASPTLSNTIVAGSTGSAALNISGSLFAIIKYCDFANNTSGNFSGTLPPGLGQLYHLNANGDSCDSRYNIFLDPMFVNPDSGDFHLLAGSPCIDAGDPASPRDPDLTVTDIGAFYFNQATPVLVGLTPHDPPIVIPPQGGSFQFDCQIHNNDSTAHLADLYLSVVLPGGAVYPIASRSNINLPVGASLLRNNLTQVVPGSAAPGNYQYKAILREHSTWVLLDDDAFPFQKAFGEITAGGNDSWHFLGWDVEQEITLPTRFALEAPYPNPFNPITVIRYQMPEARHINLRVYDTAGKLVTTLVDGWREAGSHEVTFDGSQFSSGLYFVRMEAGELAAVQKVILIK